MHFLEENFNIRLAVLQSEQTVEKRSRRTSIEIKFSDMRGEFGFLEAVAKRKQYP